nr:MAG TPA: hypothetical protein [Caudoviricetes sp.]
MQTTTFCTINLNFYPNLTKIVFKIFKVRVRRVKFEYERQTKLKFDKFGFGQICERLRQRTTSFAGLFRFSFNFTLFDYFNILDYCF